MENEVFAGRRSYLPALPDLNKQVEQVTAERIRNAEARGETLPELDKGGLRKYMATVRMELLAKMGEVRPGGIQQWYYNTLPKSYGGPVFVRYKIYSGSLFSKDQKMAMGMWLLRYVQVIYDENELLENNIMNARCTEDTNKNKYVNKKKSSGKVDMVVSTINAVYLWEQEQLYGSDFTVQVV